jgi:hypothetical protein
LQNQNAADMSFLKKMWLVCVSLIMYVQGAFAQCSICTKTAQQLGKESAEGLNSGIVYLMLLPFAIGGVIAYRWWKNEKSVES